jgi:hypothetical protein
MGEVVDANRMASTNFKIDFLITRKDEIVCDKKLSVDEMRKFRLVSVGAGG